jgi:GAF domain-containing protein
MAAQPVDETARLAALERYRILDTEPERAFDDLVVIAAQICGTPIAFIGLVDADWQWFKTRIGLSIAEVARAVSFCSAHTIKQRGLIVVPKAQEDDRLRNNPLVTGEPHIRFYAGAPLVTPDGHALGTLCVVHRVERTLTAEQLEALEALKRQAEAQLELRQN